MKGKKVVVDSWIHIIYPAVTEIIVCSDMFVLQYNFSEVVRKIVKILNGLV